MYGASAGRYFELVGSALSDEVETSADLELLTRFVRAARATGDRALDAGCGTGRAGRLLADHGFDTVGVDIADGMVEIADREHPDLNFIVAQLDRLPFARSRFSTVVCWYSIITTPPDEIIGAFGELHRVLIDGGVVLVAFQAGEGESVKRPNAYGTEVDLTLFRHSIGFIIDALHRSGFDIDSVTERPPEREHEDSPQAFITATTTPERSCGLNQR